MQWGGWLMGFFWGGAWKWVVDCLPPGFIVYIWIAFITLVQPIELENEVSPCLCFQAKFTQS